MRTKLSTNTHHSTATSLSWDDDDTVEMVEENMVPSLTLGKRSQQQPDQSATARHQDDSGSSSSFPPPAVILPDPKQIRRGMSMQYICNTLEPIQWELCEIVQVRYEPGTGYDFVIAVHRNGKKFEKQTTLERLRFMTHHQEQEEATRRSSAASKQATSPSSKSPSSGSSSSIHSIKTPTDEPAQKHKNNKEANAKAKAKPTLWQLAGRSIKKYPVGKALLNGVRDGFEGSLKVLGIGVGEIRIREIPPTVFQTESVVSGVVEMDLTEPLCATRLVVEIKAIQYYQMRPSSSSTSKSKHTNIVADNADDDDDGEGPEEVYSMEYEIGGRQHYATTGRYSFQVVVPRLRRQMSDATTSTFLGSVLSSLETFSMSQSPPPVWFLVARLDIPGRLSMRSDNVRIHVADEGY